MADTNMPPAHAPSRARRRPTPVQPRRSVLMIGSEALPFSKTGGLADVLGALPQALARLGGTSRWSCRDIAGRPAASSSIASTLRIGGYHADVGFFEAPLGDGARALLDRRADAFRSRLSCTNSRSGDYPDNARRFARAGARGARVRRARSGAAPTVVHAHDWQAGLAPVYLKTFYATHPAARRHAASCSRFTTWPIRGCFEPDWLPRLDLPWSLLTIEAAGVLGKDQLSQGRHQLRGRHHDRQSAVRRGDSDAGVRLRVRRHSSRARAADLVGILNGIDTEQWDPARDPFLPKPFSARRSLGKARVESAPCSSSYGLPADERSARAVRSSA